MEFLSDIDRCVPGRVCEAALCEAPATHAVEWDMDGARIWECFCEMHLDATLAIWQDEAPMREAQEAADALAREAWEAEQEREARAAAWEALKAHLVRQEATAPIPAYWGGLDTSGEY